MYRYMDRKFLQREIPAHRIGTATLTSNLYQFYSSVVIEIYVSLITTSLYEPSL